MLIGLQGARKVDEPLCFDHIWRVVEMACAIVIALSGARVGREKMTDNNKDLGYGLRRVASTFDCRKCL